MSRSVLMYTIAVPATLIVAPPPIVTSTPPNAAYLKPGTPGHELCACACVENARSPRRATRMLIRIVVPSAPTELRLIAVAAAVVANELGDLRGRFGVLRA